MILKERYERKIQVDAFTTVEVDAESGSDYVTWTIEVKGEKPLELEIDLDEGSLVLETLERSLRVAEGSMF